MNIVEIKLILRDKMGREHIHERESENIITILTSLLN